MFVFVLLAPKSNAEAVSSKATSSIKLQNSKMAASYSTFHGVWNLSLGTRSFEEATDDAKSANVALRIKPEYHLSPNLKIKADLRIKSESGRVQSRFASNSNFFSVSNAVVEYFPTSLLLLEGGIVNQSYLGQELLFSSQRGFAGVREGLIFEKGSLRTSLIFQQSLPSSTSLNTERSEKEESPAFTAQTLKIEVNNERVEGNASGSLFQYNNLPSKVAYESGITGNSILGEDAANSKFVYEFSGYGLQSNLHINVSKKIGLAGGLQLIENTKADPGNGRGQINWVGSSVKIGQNIVSVKYGSFFAEPDVTPSYYMSLLYGGTNRQGEFGKVEVEFTKLKFKILAQYVDADVINQRVHQFARTNYLVSLETLYVSF